MTPSPVIDSTPMMIEAHRMIAAIMDTCRAAVITAEAKRAATCSRLHCRLPFTNSNSAPARIANAAAYSGVNCAQNMPHSSTVKGTRKNSEVMITSRDAGRSAASTPFRSNRRA